MGEGTAKREIIDISYLTHWHTKFSFVFHCIESKSKKSVFVRLPQDFSVILDFNFPETSLTSLGNSTVFILALFFILYSFKSYLSISCVIIFPVSHPLGIVCAFSNLSEFLISASLLHHIFYS